MRQSIAILSFLASAVLADDVLSFVFPGGYDGIAPVATVQTANPSITSALMTCPTGTAVDECAWPNGLDVEIISGTRYEAVMSAASMYVSWGCDYNSAAVEMTCTAEMTGEDPQTAVLSGSDVAFITATVVEGAEMLGGASATASVSVASKSSAAVSSSVLRTSTALASSTAAAGSHASSSASTATASSSLPQSTGAAAKFSFECAALLAVAGAAALNAL